MSMVAIVCPDSTPLRAESLLLSPYCSTLMRESKRFLFSVPFMRW